MVRMNRGRGESGEWEKPFWQQRGWVLSAGFLLSLAALGGVAALAGGGEDGSRGTEAAPAGTPSAPPTAGGGSDGRPEGCGTDDSDQDTPTEPPKDLKWKSVGSSRVPTSASVGPTSFEGRVWSCYARTPMGAVMAVHGISSQMSYPGWRDVVEKQFVPGNGTDAFVEKRSKLKDTPLTEGPDKGNYVGFSVLSYSENQAAVMMLMEIDGDHLSTSLSVKWEAGDWKLLPQSNGSITSAFSRASGTNGFVLWETPDE
ncbi:hypothetical protein DMH02_002035 [Streptomyces sp. WAC 00631]|uniref:hypothetical protein n=1 Tax=unclassified Streptomyces TaxID=2593676 RepID=UPI000F7A2482|nr:MULTISPECIES: hypothetical protein [unclassified Streptomyces]MCC5032072.1 hypothetical protein [Streptomyces sp. WAC 00631]MCC9740174.1 hypothetical protein [Streptomyces sp. MNU89]